MRKRRTVRSTLFSSYVLLLLPSVLFLTLFAFAYTSDALRNMAVDSLKDVSSAVLESLNVELQKMSNVSTSVTFSGLLRDRVRDHLKMISTGRGRDGTAEYRSASRIVEVMQTVIGPFKPVPQVNYFDLHGTMIGAGVYSQAAPVAASVEEALREFAIGSDSKRFSLPADDPLLSRTSSLYPDKRYISLYRPYYDEFRNLLGVIEVKQFTDVIFGRIPDLSRNTYVVNREGIQLYPFELPTGHEAPTQFAALVEGRAETTRDAESGARQIAILRTSRVSDWQVVVFQNERSLFRPVYRFAILMVVLTGVLLVAAIFAASRFARTLTTPLQRLHDDILQLDWDQVNLAPNVPQPSEVNELELIQRAFLVMQRKLRDSMNEVVEARSHEIQATILAYQSQVDPHFIYNMLATIDALADDGRTEEISLTIERLSSLLRYISSARSPEVTIREEIEYARLYLECTKIRFRENLAYNIAVPAEIEEIRIPKLILQPLVENAIKYGTRVHPPWDVSIIGSYENDRWKLRVSDTGPGFTEEALADFRGEISTRLASPQQPDLSIRGLGLRSIASRLRLYYGPDAHYQIGNTESGAFVEIGGRCGRNG
ncbi:sensor histidine kinase [Salinispira pacifica]